MLALFLASSSSSGTTADLFPPFTVAENGKIGFWELGGSATRYDDCIMLVPPIQFKRGSIWSNVELPTDPFSIDYIFRVHEGTNGGNLAFWYVDRYGADGDLAGGPRIFRGLAVIMTVRRSTRGSQASLGWHVIQHSEQTALIPETEMVQPGLVIPWSRTGPSTLSIAFTADRHLVITLTAGTDRIPIYDGEVTADLAGAFIGLTAQSDIFTSRFDLEGIKFNLVKSSRPREGVSFGDERPKSNYIPEKEAALRNPAFIKTIQVLMAQLQNVRANFTDSEIPADEILTVVDELIRASNTVASYSELNDWVRKTLIPYTQKWHRRTAKIVDNIRDARNVMGAAWNYTQQMMWALNSSVLANSRKAAFKMQDLGGLFENESGKLAGVAGQLQSSTVASTSTQFFVALSLIEVAFVVVFFLVMQKRQFRIALFGS
jgi:hypothetical protein